jgi:precorrin-2 dehydrogenase / sirohydrochlorin ferrochelatase
VDAFPAFFPLAGRTVVIAGVGEGAEAKVRLFAGSPARIVRVMDDSAFDPGAYTDATLAFIAHADAAWAAAAAAAARAAHVPVNVTDRPALCDFTTPAVIDRGEVVAAIGTGGGSPMLATLLRQDIEARIPEGAGRIAALFRTMQDEVRAALPDLPLRRAFLRVALTGPAAQAAMDGDLARATTMLRQALSDGEAGGGMVQYLDGRGPVDLLTLRAARALAAADVLVSDPGVDPGILALARRDAERWDGLPTVQIADLVDSGRRVVRLTAAAAASEQAQLARLGVAFEVLQTGG